ncbi:MAG: hypothetical protein U5R14_12490 [Gemmatimonadota bacterium]|nr:hypothetical protein [Gemmatimonadota bacterium]
MVNEDLQREGWRPYLVLGIAVLAVGLVSWRPFPAGVWHDDGVYMMVAKALAEGHGFTYQGVVGAPPAVKFPPVYPAFLGGLWALFGSIGPVTLVATLANVLFLALAGVLLARAVRLSTGAPLGIALGAGGLAVVSGDVLRTSSAVLSEPLFLAMVGGCLLLWPSAVDPGVTSRETTRARIALAALLVLLIGTRAAGMAFVVAFGVAMALRAGVRSGLWVAGPALAGWFGWSAWAGRRGRAVPEHLSDLLGPYSGWMREQALADPGAFVARLPGHVVGVLERVAVLLLPRVEGVLLWAAALPLFALAVYGAVYAVRRFPPLAWSALAYAGLLFAWPYLDRRLVVPLHLLVVALLGIGAYRLISSIGPGRRASVVATLFAAWVGFYGFVGAHRIAVGWPTAAYEIRAERLAGAVEAMGRTVPSDAVVGAPEFWSALYLHGGWTVAPSGLFTPAVTDADAPVWGTPEEQEHLWLETGVEYLLLEQGGTMHGATLDRLEARCPGMVRVVARMSPMLLVHLDRSGAIPAPEGSRQTFRFSCPSES